MQASRNIAFITFNSFPVDVERVVNRSLRDRPVVLVQSANPRTRCLSLSSEASQQGIHRGMTLREAKRCTRDLTLIYPNPPLYQRASKAIQRIISNFTPVAEPVGYGKNYLDLTGSNRLFGGAIQATEMLRSRIANELYLHADAGLSSNKLISRAASFYSDPTGLLSIENGFEKPFIAPKHVRILPVVDLDIHTRLQELNILIIERLQQIELDQLAVAFGATALSLSRQARGIDPEPVTPPTCQKVITVANQLEEDSNDKSELLQMLRLIIVEATQRMLQEGLSARSVRLSISYSDAKTVHAHTQLRSQTHSLQVWLKTVDDMFRRLLSRRIRVRRLEVQFFKLTKNVTQMELWDSTKKVNKTEFNRSSIDVLQDVLQKVSGKYGESALKLGMVN